MSLENQPVKITLYYKGDVIYTENTKYAKILNRVFRLLKNKEGNYTVAISTNEKKYSKSFKI